MNIKDRIKKVATLADSEKERVFTEEWEKRQMFIESEVLAIDKEAGKGLQVGRALWLGVGDGNACYLVTKVRKHDVVVEWVPMGDNYWSDVVRLNRGRTEYIVDRDYAERSVGLNDLFKS